MQTRRPRHLAIALAAALIGVSFVSCDGDRATRSPSSPREEQYWVLPASGEKLPYTREAEIFAPDPPYAELAESPMLKRGEGMHVVLEFCVDPEGAVDAVEVKRSSGEDYLDTVMVRTIRRRRYRPITRDGEAVRACSRIEYKMVPK